MSGVFQRVLVPIEVQPAAEAEIQTDRAVEVGNHDWVAVGEATIKALRLAAQLAEGGEVWLVHATPDFFDYATVVPAASISELTAGATRHATAVIEAIGERHCPNVDLSPRRQARQGSRRDF